MSAPPKGRIPALDGLRGLAALTIFVFHYGGGAQSANPLLHTAGVVARVGWIGVPLFFVLSGFLISGILWDSFGDPHWAKKFYIRRMLRIFPLYYGALLLTLLGALAVGTFHGALRAIWIPALFLQNISGLAERVEALPSPMLLHHFWTLAVEEQFYLLWPLMLSRTSTRQSAARLCAAVFFGSLVFRAGLCVAGRASPDCIALLLSRAGELAAGGWLAIAYRGAAWERVQRSAPAVLALCAMAFLAISWWAGTTDLVGSSQVVGGLAVLGPACAALIALALRPGVWQKALSARWLQSIGQISFGIYVFHILLRPLYWQLTHRIVAGNSGAWYFGVRFIVAAAATLLVAWFSHRFYEQPFLRLKRYFRTQAGSEGAAVATE
jgi:peptidoglycan/LPS O-acetylase OafA/YrhL